MHRVLFSAINRVERWTVTDRYVTDSYRALLVVHLTLPRALDPLGGVSQLDEDVGVEDQHHNLIW